MDLTLINRLEIFKSIVANSIATNVENKILDTEEGLKKAYNLLIMNKQENKHTFVIGNGGSAAIASHAVIDFMNVAKLSAHTIHDSATLTCMANDYGYENVFSNILKVTIKENDTLIAISSSGNSKNIINAVNTAKLNAASVITLSGFDSENTLRSLGDLNFWCNAKDYGMVEIAHQFILHNLVDRFNVNLAD